MIYPDPEPDYGSGSIRVPRLGEHGVTETRSNLLVVLCDQLRWDALGAPNVAAPCLDRLVRDGVSFTFACSSCPICVPFRFTLMTGECAHFRFVPGIEWRMSPAERMLANEFNEAGYESIYVGQWPLCGGHVLLLPGYSPRKANLTPVPRDHQEHWQQRLGFELRNSHFDTCYDFEDDDSRPRRSEGCQTDGLFDLVMRYLEGRAEPSRLFACILSFEPPHFSYEVPVASPVSWCTLEHR